MSSMRIIIAISLTFVLVLGLCMVHARPAEAMQLLTVNISISQITHGNYRPVSLTAGDEIVQFRRSEKSIRILSDTVAYFETKARGSGTVTGGLTGSTDMEWNSLIVPVPVTAGMDGFGWALGKLVFNGSGEYAGSSITAIWVTDFDYRSTGQPNIFHSGYWISVEETGVFSGEKFIFQGSMAGSDNNWNGTVMVRRYTSSEVSGPFSISATGIDYSGNVRLLGGSSGSQPFDEFIQFRNSNVQISPGGLVVYTEGGSTSVTLTSGPMIGTVNHTYNNLGVVADPMVRGLGFGSFSGTAADGTSEGVFVSDTINTGPTTADTHGYMFAFMEDVTGSTYEGKDYFSIYDSSVDTSIAPFPFSVSGSYYVLTPAGGTPEGEDITIQLSEAIVRFDTVTAEGDTTTTISQGNPVGGIPEGFRVRGLFVDITTTATYSPPVTVGLYYDPSEPNPQNLKLFHWEGGHWVDVTTWVDTTNHIVYGEVNFLSWFFIGGQWVWVDGGGGGATGVPVFPNIYIGIGAALGAGVVAYFVRRKLVRPG